MSPSCRLILEGETLFGAMNEIVVVLMFKTSKVIVVELNSVLNRDV